MGNQAFTYKQFNIGDDVQVKYGDKYYHGKIMRQYNEGLKYDIKFIDGIKTVFSDEIFYAENTQQSKDTYTHHQPNLLNNEPKQSSNTLNNNIYEYKHEILNINKLNDFDKTLNNCKKELKNGNSIKLIYI